MTEAAFGTAAAKSAAPKHDPKRKPARPSNRSQSTDGRIFVDANPEQLATLTEWAAAKNTTPEALLGEAFEEMMARVDTCVAAYRKKRAAFDAETVVEIERDVDR